MDTTARPPISEPAFHADDVEEIAGYRSLSALAIVGLVFGLASPLCFIAPLLLAIPVFGAAMSIIALRRIAASDGALAGRWAATAGLALCVAFGVAAISSDVATRYLRTRQAAQFGRQWLRLLVADNAVAAFRLTVAGARPTPPPPEPGMPEDTTNPYDEFLNQPEVQAITAAGADSRIKLAETLTYEAQSRGQFFVRQRFRITPAAAPAAADAAEKPIEAILRLQRSRFPGDRASHWLVSAVEEPHAHADATHVH